VREAADASKSGSYVRFDLLLGDRRVSFPEPGPKLIKASQDLGLLRLQGFFIGHGLIIPGSG
jgi:hypothetical protein